MSHIALNVTCTAEIANSYVLQGQMPDKPVLTANAGTRSSQATKSRLPNRQGQTPDRYIDIAWVLDCRVVPATDRRRLHIPLIQSALYDFANLAVVPMNKFQNEVLDFAHRYGPVTSDAGFTLNFWRATAWSLYRQLSGGWRTLQNEQLAIFQQAFPHHDPKALDVIRRCTTPKFVLWPMIADGITSALGANGGGCDGTFEAPSLLHALYAEAWRIHQLGPKNRPKYAICQHCRRLVRAQTTRKTYCDDDVRPCRSAARTARLSRIDDIAKAAPTT